MTESTGSTRWRVPPAPDGLVPLASAPTFSVVIPAYNAASTIAEAVTSALAQRPRPQEVVVCDDGSTDGLVDALEPFRDEIILVRQDNRGVGAARNRALREVTADFVDMLDADDVLLPDRHRRLGELARRRPDLSLLTADVGFDVEGVVTSSYYGVNEFHADDQRAAMLVRNFIPAATAARRVSVAHVGGYDESLTGVEDWDMWLRLVLAGARIGQVEEVLALYRIREGSVSAARADAWELRARVLRKAASSGQLNPTERAEALHRARQLDATGVVAQAEQALLSGASDARRRAARVVLAGGVSMRTRVKSVMAVAMPGAAADRLRRRGAAEGRRLRRQVG